MKPNVIALVEVFVKTKLCAGETVCAFTSPNVSVDVEIVNVGAVPSPRSATVCPIGGLLAALSLKVSVAEKR